MTILSTTLGMIPFFIDGPEAQPFWYSLAMGTIGGLLPSLVWILFAMPALLSLRGKKICSK